MRGGRSQRRGRIAGAALALVAAVALMAGGARPAMGFEADQFTLPPEPLADLGPVLHEHVDAHLARILASLNEAIAAEQAAAAAAPRAFAARRHAQRAEAYLDERRVATALYDALGPGWPEAKVETWLHRETFDVDRPARFELRYGDSVFGASAVWKPLLLVAMSPTVNLYDSLMSIDKVGHFFQQGWQYYERYLDAEARGASVADARAAAIRLGVDQENTVMGRWVVGAYSNADLAANYAGFQFYLNLTRPVTVDREELPPVLLRENGRWAFNPDRREDYLRPFISDHMNEAFNPAEYDRVMHRPIRRSLDERRDAWVARYGNDRVQEELRTFELATWFGHEYGHSGFDKVITPASAFFETEDERRKRLNGRARPSATPSLPPPTRRGRW